MIFELVAKLACGVQRVVLDHDRPEPEDRIERHDVLRGVGQYQGHPVAGADPEPTQSLGGPFDLLAEVTVRRDGTEEVQRRSSGERLDTRREHLGQRLRWFLDLGGDAFRIGIEPGTCSER